MTYKEIMDLFKSGGREVTTWFILEMMKDNIVDYSDITSAYLSWVEGLKKTSDQRTQTLSSDIVSIAVDFKKNRGKNIKRALQHLDDFGMINMTKEQIEKYGE